MASTIMPQDDHDLLIRLDTKVDSLTQEIRHYNTSTGDTLKDHEGRLRSLENAQEINKGTQSGTASNRRTLLEVLGTAAAVLTALATYLVASHH